jgi:hypothetical protein
MKSSGFFSPDSRHLVVLASLLVFGGVAFKLGTRQLVPDTFGDKGPYRAAALEELKNSRPAVEKGAGFLGQDKLVRVPKHPLIPSDAQCLACHAEVGEERKEALHKEVNCYHCHGVGTEHMAQATKAKEAGVEYKSNVQQWDGNFLTKQDLYNTKDRKACLVCHEQVTGMSEDFSSIVVEQHLKEEEAEHPEKVDVCFECHEGHDTAP